MLGTIFFAYAGPLFACTGPTSQRLKDLLKGLGLFFVIAEERVELVQLRRLVPADLIGSVQTRNGRASGPDKPTITFPLINLLLATLRQILRIKIDRVADASILLVEGRLHAGQVRPIAPYGS